jgi:glycosyltransferase involved in cell wall biosynthesis
MYNCETQIVRVLDQLRCEAGAYLDQVIIVNNRSTDNGEQAVSRRLQEGGFPCAVTLLRNRENYGLGGSHKLAFSYAVKNGFDYVVVLHGDDQGHLEDLLPLLKNKAYQDYDCCLGARFMKGSTLEGYSLFRTFGNRVYNMLFSIVTCRRIYDLGSGLNLYRTDMLKSNFFHQFCDNLQFNYCMVLALQFYKNSALFFPIRWSEDDQVSNVKLTRQAANVLGLLFSYAFARRRFMQRELRAVPHARYEADEIVAIPSPPKEARI